MDSTTFDYKVVRVARKSDSPIRSGSWLFGRVKGHWDGKRAYIYALPSATEEEIMLAVTHEKAHVLLGHPKTFEDIEQEMLGEIEAWETTLEILPKPYRTKRNLAELIKAVEL